MVVLKIAQQLVLRYAPFSFLRQDNVELWKYFLLLLLRGMGLTFVLHFINDFLSIVDPPCFVALYCDRINDN